MTIDEILNKVQNPICDISSAEEGCVQLIDDLYVNETDYMKGGIAYGQMHPEIVKSVGGWFEYTRRLNYTVMRQYFSKLLEYGYKAEKIDYFENENNTLVMIVGKTK